MPPRVLLLHSGITDARSWDPLLIRMGDEARLVALNVPFHHPTQHVLEALGGEPALLVGNSFGGMVALDVAARQPELVRALLLLAPAVADAGPSEALAEFDAEETAALEAGDLDAAVELNLDVWVGPDEGLRGSVESQCRAALLRQIEAVEYDWEFRSGPRRCPVHVMVGDADLPDFMAIGERLREDGATLEVLPGIRHLVALEAPDAVAAALRALLSRLR